MTYCYHQQKVQLEWENANLVASRPTGIWVGREKHMQRLQSDLVIESCERSR